VNVVASAVLDQKLDLDDIAVKLPDVEFHPE
jgi:TATA-box binding protein (TBP) (component of TFIID and TFIIIB)